MMRGRIKDFILKITTFCGLLKAGLGLGAMLTIAKYLKR